MNPHNDYCQNYIDTGQYPANYIRDVSMEKRFAEYPKIKELIDKKSEVTQKSHCPPTYLNGKRRPIAPKKKHDLVDLRTYNLEDLNCQFDSIVIDAPLEEYKTTALR